VTGVLALAAGALGEMGHKPTMRIEFVISAVPPQADIASAFMSTHPNSKGAMRDSIRISKASRRLLGREIKTGRAAGNVTRTATGIFRLTKKGMQRRDFANPY
jgi:hypothetical protein